VRWRKEGDTFFPPDISSCSTSFSRYTCPQVEKREYFTACSLKAFSSARTTGYSLRENYYSEEDEQNLSSHTAAQDGIMRIYKELDIQSMCF